MSGLEQAVGGRPQLVEILSTADRDTKQDILFRLLADPARAKDSLAKLCIDAGVSETEILTLYRDATMARGLVRAQTTLVDRLEAVVGDVADKAINHLEPCPKCVALGRPAISGDGDICEECNGAGEIYHRGEFSHAKLVFESAGLVQKGGGVNVAVNQNVGVSVGGGFLDRFVKATDQAAFDVVEGEFAESVEPEAGSEDS